MREYLAKYQVYAYEIGFGRGLPYEENETHRLKASNKKEVIKLALEKGREIVKNRIGATITLENLFEIREIPINKTQITKLPMTNIIIAKNYFLFMIESLTRVALSFAFSSKVLAQTNSVAKIINPKIINTNPGTNGTKKPKNPAKINKIPKINIMIVQTNLIPLNTLLNNPL